MDANEYQDKAITTEIYSKAAWAFTRNPNYQWAILNYCAGKLHCEAGELSEIVLKAFRDEHGYIDAERHSKILKELGDVLWYCANIADILGENLGEIMQSNLDKLADRKERGVISGSGDDR